MAEFGGFPVDLDSIPEAARKRFPLGMTEDDFNVRLAEGGQLVLDGNDLKLGEPDFHANSAAFIALDTLELRNGARIVTGGNIVTIIVNKLKSSNGAILAFKDSERKAADGADGIGAGAQGMAGAPGDAGGAVSIHVIQSFDGHLTVDLSGQTGGRGGNGAPGAAGAPGARGHDAADEVLWCKHAGQDGHQGGTGLPGGNGGNGGAGGSGGVFYLFNVGTVPIDPASITFLAQGGAGGEPGAAGVGGPGGRGGEGGSGSRHCTGGHAGPSGLQGSAGATGMPGPQAADGTFERRNLSLVAMLHSGLVASSAT